MSYRETDSNSVPVHIETFIKAQNGDNIKTLSVADIAQHFVNKLKSQVFMLGR